jgi:hypothetical protein
MLGYSIRSTQQIKYNNSCLVPLLLFYEHKHLILQTSPIRNSKHLRRRHLHPMLQM